MICLSRLCNGFPALCLLGGSVHSAVALTSKGIDCDASIPEDNRTSRASDPAGLGKPLGLKHATVSQQSSANHEYIWRRQESSQPYDHTVVVEVQVASFSRPHWRSVTISSTASPEDTLSQPWSSSRPSTISSSIAPNSTANLLAQPPAINGDSRSHRQTLQVALVNNLNSSNVHAYVSGQDRAGNVVMLTSSGVYYKVEASHAAIPESISADVSIPMAGPGITTKVTLPDFISSARVWFADGYLNFSALHTQDGPKLVEPTIMNLDDPSADINWGFIELTFQYDYGLFADLSFVDFLGLPLGIQLLSLTNRTQIRCGVPQDAVSQVCELLRDQARQDGQPWGSLCMNNKEGDLLRVVSPPSIISQTPEAFHGYFDEYVHHVYQRFTKDSLIIDPQTGAENVICTSNGAVISCTGDNTAYARPTASDIFGCNSGPFAPGESDNDVRKLVVPRLCAAFNRGTLHLPGGNVQPSLPPREYYTSEPNNWYSAFIHQVETDGMGYAFPYDDVAPSSDEMVDGSVYAPDPDLLTIFVGGALSYNR